MAKVTNIIGLMSGTSVDGLDLAYCSFDGKGFSLKAVQAFSYPEDIQHKLMNNLQLSPAELFALDAELGYFFGKCVNTFLKKSKLPKPEAIASHGHTVYHDPQKHYSVQIGKGSHLAAVTGIPVIADFRNTDIAYGGQGAPLVPIGDELLFTDYDYCLNLGGIANVSYRQKNKRIAYDISPCNLPANLVMQRHGKAYDENGSMGLKGEVDPELLEQLNGLEYYHQKAPKSLGREWIERELMPLLKSKHTPNVLRTYYESISSQIAQAIDKKGATVLVTGGGAHNRFLMRLISAKTSSILITPQHELIDFKEAIVFAFLGYRRIYHKANSLKTVTGASKDSIGGCIYLP